MVLSNVLPMVLLTPCMLTGSTPIQHANRDRTGHASEGETA